MLDNLINFNDEDDQDEGDMSIEGDMLIQVLSSLEVTEQLEEIEELVNSKVKLKTIYTRFFPKLCLFLFFFLNHAPGLLPQNKLFFCLENYKKRINKASLCCCSTRTWIGDS
jgi:hypothetical protein